MKGKFPCAGEPSSAQAPAVGLEALPRTKRPTEIEPVTRFRKAFPLLIRACFAGLPALVFFGGGLNKTKQARTDFLEEESYA
jgi:hypothetical protein